MASNDILTTSMYDTDDSVTLIPIDYDAVLTSPNDPTSTAQLIKDVNCLLKEWDDFIHKEHATKNSEDTVKPQDQKNYYCPLKDIFVDKDINFITTTSSGKDVLKIFVDSII